LFSNGGGSATTDASGNFTKTGLTNRTYATVDFMSPTGTSAAVELVNVRVNGATSIGTVVMQPGATITGTVLAPPGLTAVGGNMNVYDTAGLKRFTPNDAILPGGTFSIVVPLGFNRVRAVPPVGSGLMPFDWTLTSVTGPLNVGTITLERGYPLSATVVDAVSGLPLPGVKLKATNALTGQLYAQLVDVTDVFGGVTLSLPGFVVVDIDLTPTSTDPHMPTQVFGVISLPHPTAFGLIGIKSALFVSGNVLGPGGPVAGADMDFYDAANHKLFTPKDNTNAAGVFSVRVPAGTYRVTTQPAPATGLTCGEIPSVTITANGNIGTINVQSGVLLSGHLLGPAGAEANGELRAFHPVTGQQLILAGNHTDATGAFAMVLPAGTWNIVASAVQGSTGATTTFANFSIAGSLVHDFTLPLKSVVVNVTSFTTLTVAQGTPLPISLFVENLTSAPLPTLLEVLIQYQSGAETPLFPPIPIGIVQQIPVSLGPVFALVPPIPAGELDQPISYMFRFRSPATGLVIDQAYTTFLVH